MVCRSADGGGSSRPGHDRPRLSCAAGNPRLHCAARRRGRASGNPDPARLRRLQPALCPHRRPARSPWLRRRCDRHAASARRGKRVSGTERFAPRGGVCARDAGLDAHSAPGRRRATGAARIFDGRDRDARPDRPATSLDAAGRRARRRRLLPGGCRNRTAANLRTPLLILIGTADDWTPAAPCRDLAAAGARLDAPVSIVQYEGATHSFDVARRLRSPLAIRCRRRVRRVAPKPYLSGPVSRRTVVEWGAQ